MCEPVGPHDSRKDGWYCCRCNTYNVVTSDHCRICEKKKHEPK